MANRQRKPRTAAVPAPAVEVETITFQQALEEAGQTIEELVAPAEEAKPERQPGTSNLACTIRKHRANYRVALHPNGKKTQNNGDVVAVLLLAVPLDALKAYSATRFGGRRYDHLNDGHARMCIGNNIRAEVKKGARDVLEWLEARQPKQEEEAA